MTCCISSKVCWAAASTTSLKTLRYWRAGDTRMYRKMRPEHPALPASGDDHLHMDRALADRESCFLDRLGQRRMRVAGAGDVFGGCAEFHRHRRFCDQIARIGSEDMHTEHAI